MIFFYYFLCVLAHFLCVAPLFLLAIFKSKYKSSIPARFFLFKNLRSHIADVHFHACSFGEAKAIEELVKKFKSRVSVITKTGFDCASKYSQKVNFLAFESLIPFWFRPCKILVIFEAELWLMLIFVAKIRGAKIILINARISEKSFSKYHKFGFFYRKIFSLIDEVFAQSKQDSKRLEILGAKNIKISSNIKAMARPNLSWNFSKINEELIIFASTHDKEEELLLSNFTPQKGEKLIIAPRHPERFENVAKLLEKMNFKFNKFSELDLKNSSLERAWSEKILLLDKLGILNEFYAISDVVVLGGSFFEGIGGHNPIEPSHFKNCLISGQFIHNQNALFSILENVQICDNPKKIQNLIRDTKLIAKIKEKSSLEPIISSIQEGLNARKSL